MPFGKDWYKSKTLWFAALTIIIGVAASVFGFDTWAPDGATADLIQTVILVVVGIVNIVLRYVTSEAIKKRGA